ncbi:MAG: SpoVA/SpoVAEb family sporulation membrane protein [Firmicutes bacterium]|nr:SpoVA/SpoVAEb family sporulation membrane protein [Bacillota bacterium]
MVDEQTKKSYQQYVEAKIPKTKAWPSLFHAFWVGGLICCLGQLLMDLLLEFMPGMSKAGAAAWMLVALIFLASFLTAIGVFDRIGAFAGAGTFVPITGFSNSITSPAMEFRHEGIVFGMTAKMFIIAGPVIVFGVVGSILVGLIRLLTGNLL